MSRPTLRLSALTRERMDLFRDHLLCVHRETGETVAVSADELGAAEDGDDDECEFLGADPEQLRRILDDSRWFTLEAATTEDSADTIRRFIRRLPAGDAADRLARAFDGRGAFRRFREALRDAGLREEWQRYQEWAVATETLDDLRALDVEVEVDLDLEEPSPVTPRSAAELIAAFAAALDAQDTAALPALFRADAVFHDAAGRRVNGRDAVVAVWRERIAVARGELRVELPDVVAEGNRAAAFGTWSAPAHADGPARRHRAAVAWFAAEQGGSLQELREYGPISWLR